MSDRLRQPQQGGQALPAGTEQADRAFYSPYLSAHEAVRYLRLGSLGSLYRLCREHRLPYGRRGKTYIFDVRKIDRWVEATGSGADFLRRKVG
jgi:hypothetical protein